MEEAVLPAVRTSGYDSRDLIDRVVYPRRALSARRGEKHSLQRRQSPSVFDFLPSVPENQGHLSLLTVCLFIPT